MITGKPKPLAKVKTTESKESLKDFETERELSQASDLDGSKQLTPLEGKDTKTEIEQKDLEKPHTRVRSATSLSDISTYSEATDAGDQINLNVGGHFFSTTKATLTRTGGKDSFFVSMFSGRFPIVRDKTERIFIDRDGTHFRHILNFLRDGGERWDPAEINLSKNELKQLHREVRFYNIQPLFSQLNQHLLKLKKREIKKQHVVIMDGDRYYVSLAVELFISNGFTVDGYTGTASSNSKWVSVLLRGDRRRLLKNQIALAHLRELLVSRHLVTEFFAQMDEREAKAKERRAAGGGGGGGLPGSFGDGDLGAEGTEVSVNLEQGSEADPPPEEDVVDDI